MAGLEELKNKLQPLLFDDPDGGGTRARVPIPEDTPGSYVVSKPWIHHWSLIAIDWSTALCGVSHLEVFYGRGPPALRVDLVAIHELHCLYLT